VKYFAVARTTVLSGLMYDRDLLVRSIFMLVVMVIFAQLWSTTFASTGLAIIQGLSARDVIWYMVITEALAISKPQIAQVIDGEVRAGDVAYRLARPYSYPLYHLAAFWGEALVRLPASLLVGALVALLAVGVPALTLGGVLGLLISLVCAVTLTGAFEVLIGLSAFWVEDTLPIYWIWSKFVLTLGGVLLPLELFPDWLRDISRLLPFASAAYAPGRLFVSFDFGTALNVVLVQLVWIGLAWLLVTLAFRRATRRVVAHGG
jgi:ABC-2 type transport system permease protein